MSFSRVRVIFSIGVIFKVCIHSGWVIFNHFISVHERSKDYQQIGVTIHLEVALTVFA